MRWAIHRLLGGRAADRPALAREASPIAHVARGASPFLIVHGTADDFVPLEQSMRLHAALRDAGVDSTLYIVEGAGHSAHILERTEVQEMAVRTLDRYLKPREAPATPSLAAGRPPRYSGRCARIDGASAARRVAAEAHTLRFRVPAGVTVAFDDLVRGPQAFASDDIGDFVIRRADGSAAFFFSNAVDDALMGVTHVLRGDDHVANTPRQILLYRAFGWDVPEFGHVPMILGPDKAKLSKRHGALSVME